MMPTPRPRPFPIPPPPPRRRGPLLWVLAGAGLVLVLVCGVAAAGGAYLLGQRSEAGPSPAAEERLAAADLARKGLGECVAASPVPNPTGGALERLQCGGSGSKDDVVVSTFPDAETARADGEAVRKATLELGVGAGSAMLVGPYWTFNCSMRVVCESAQAELGGDLLD